MPKIILILLLAIPGFAGATAQIADLIQLEPNGKQKILYMEPFSVYLRNNKDEITKLESLVTELCSASWRGYQAYWKIQNKKLLLTALFSDPCDEKPTLIPLTTFFTGSMGPVHATWYSGYLIIPQGKMTDYVHMGYESKYEAYLQITIEKGIVVENKVTNSHARY